MLLKLVCCAFFFVTVHSLSISKKTTNKDSVEEKDILESLKEFVNYVEKFNLNVSIIASEKKYGSGGWVKEDMSVTMHMPVNSDQLTEATLNNDKQDKYLKQLKKTAKQENVGVKTRVIKIVSGEDELENEQKVNEHYLIDSPSYKILTNFKNGVQGFSYPENETNEILYNYVIQDPEDPVKNVQVITAQVIIKELEVSKDFPAEVLQETKKILPSLWIGLDDNLILARLLVQHLDRKFDGDHQVLIGVDNFALNKKKFANLKVADSNVLVFIL